MSPTKETLRFGVKERTYNSGKGAPDLSENLNLLYGESGSGTTFAGKLHWKGKGKDGKRWGTFRNTGVLTRS